VKSLVQTGRKRDPRLAEVPTLYELMDQRTPEASRRVAAAILASGGFGRPMVAPPGVALELARALREGFARTMKDPEFVEEVRKRRYDLAPVSADEMQTMAREAINQPADVVERVGKILEN
jgi:tripartite-type tricarboxylate transporter receptor subunit TctC